MKRMDSVLLVDDDPVCNFINTTLLKQLHVSEDVHTVTNGKEALRFLKEQGAVKTVSVFPEAIFLDLNMPVMDGFDFLEQLNSSMPLFANVCKIFILTSSESPDDVSRCHHYDIAGYISKPLSEEKLESAIAASS